MRAYTIPMPDHEQAEALARDLRALCPREDLARIEVWTADTGEVTVLVEIADDED